MQARSAGAVFHRDGAEVVADGVANHAGDHVGRPAGREAHQDLQRRLVLRGGGQGHEEGWRPAAGRRQELAVVHGCVSSMVRHGARAGCSLTVDPGQLIVLINHCPLVNPDGPAANRLAHPGALDDLLLYRINRLLGVAGSMVIRLCEGRFGITRREWRVLACSWPMRMACCRQQLAERVQLDRARTSRAVTSLVAKKLVHRETQPGDRRQAMLALTPAGRRCTASMFPAGGDINLRASRCACCGSRRCARWRPTPRARCRAAAELAPGWTLGLRTGDTPSAERARQDRALAHGAGDHARIAEPDAHARERAGELAGVHTVVVDEWHELIGSKRGVQVQLALARLRRWNPALVDLGPVGHAGQPGRGDGTVLWATTARAAGAGRIDKPLVIDTLIPPDPGRFSWGGHLGAQMQQPVVDEIAAVRAPRWSSPMCARRPRSGTSCCWRRAPTGPARSRCTTAAGQGRARMGRAGPEGRHAEGGGGHLVAGPGRGLPAGRARAADRLGQGRGAAAAARRPQRPCAGAAQPHHPGAHQHAGAGGGRRRAPRRAGRAGRGAARPTSRWTCWCSTW
jgi:DNA-binding MarR family transcriptional regulator